MTTEQTAARVRQVMAGLFQVAAAQIAPDTSPKNLPAWDSLAHLNLVIELEQEFAISLPPERVEVMHDFAAVVAAVEAERGAEG